MSEKLRDLSFLLLLVRTDKLEHSATLFLPISNPAKMFSIVEHLGRICFPLENILAGFVFHWRTSWLDLISVKIVLETRTMSLLLLVEISVRFLSRLRIDSWNVRFLHV